MSDHSPKIHPELPYVFFLSNRGGSSQIFAAILDDDVEEVIQITNYPVDIGSFKISNEHIIFGADVYVDCDTLECTAERIREDNKNPNKGYVYDSLFVRHWDTWKVPKKYGHLFSQKFTYSPNDGLSLLGKPLDLMKNMSYNAPVPPFGGDEHFDVNDLNGLVAFTAAEVAHNSSWSTGWKTFVVDIERRHGEPRLISNTPARTQNPVFSKSGDHIAFLSMDRPGYEADRLHLVVCDTNKFDCKPIDTRIEISLSGITWGDDDQTIFTDFEYFGNHYLAALEINNTVATIVPLVVNGSCSTPVVHKDRVVFLHNSYTSPNDVFEITYTREPEPDYHRLTDVNSDLADRFNLVKPHRFSFESTKLTVFGYFFEPHNRVPGKNYPLVHLIHGGPQGAWNDGWSFRWNPQLWAAHGYAVVVIDPRGSTGYGQNFTDGVNGNWGGGPYIDLMAGVDYVLKEFPWLDKNRLFACGASYGGYMINWIEGNTNRYRALVNHDGIFDLTSAYYSTEELWFFEWEMKGPPYINSKEYEKWTPSQYVSRWKTPMLIIHGGLDFRIDYTHGIATFTALQRRGIKSRLLYFPDENHWVLKPSNSITWYKEVLGWLDENM